MEVLIVKKALKSLLLVTTLLSTSALNTFANVQAQDQKIVKISNVSEIDSLDNHIAAATATGTMLDQIHDGLVGYNTAGEVIPALAESWEISEDGLTYTFKLVENATFHNGDPVTAQDVVASYAPLAGLDGAEALNSKWEVIESITAIDDYTVEIKLESPDSGFLARTTSGIRPEGYEDQASHPIGAGPFKFVEWKQGEKLVMEKNHDYYDEENTPSIDGVEWYLMQDSATAMLALQTGEIDITNISLDEKAMLGDAFNYVEGPMNMVTVFGLNHKFEPFADERVRQALNHAINKQELIDIVFQGEAAELGSMFSPAMELYYQEGLQDMWPYDPEKAKELLAEAGYENLEFTLKAPSHAQMYTDMAQVIADQLSQVGVTAHIEMIEWSTWLEDVYTDFDHEATLIGLTGKIDPYDVLIRFVDGYHRNFINYNNEDYNTAMSNAIQEIDDATRIDYYKQAQTLLAQDAASVFLADPNRITATQPHIQGLEMFPAEKYNLEDIEFVEAE